MVHDDVEEEAFRSQFSSLRSDFDVHFTAKKLCTLLFYSSISL